MSVTDKAIQDNALSLPYRGLIRLLGAVGVGLCMSACNDKTTASLSVTPEPVVIKQSAPVKRGATLDSQAQALSVLSVIGERHNDILNRYRECRQTTAPASFDCEGFLRTVRIAIAQVDRADMEQVCHLLAALRQLDGLPANELDASAGMDATKQDNEASICRFLSR